MTYLDELVPGQRGRVIGFATDSPVTRRLLEMGLVPGRAFTYLRDAPLRDPLELQVGVSRLSLRHSEAALVAVKVEE